MLSTKLLCEFVTNPFGTEQKARELVSKIEGRELSPAELERGEFCFQITFYYLARLAIGANIPERSLQTTLLCQLHERIRAFYASAASTVCLSKLIVSATERDQINAALRRQQGDSEPACDTVSWVATTKPALFDLVGVRRLGEYGEAISRPNAGGRFYALAEQVLFHFGGRRYHPLAITIIADLLSVNYNIASEIVSSALEVVNTRQSENESSFQPLPFDPGMPDLAGRQPSRVYSAGRYVLLLFEDVVPIRRETRLRFRYVLALYDRQEGLPACLVTLEDSSSISNVLCVFERSGWHSNYGSLRGPDLLQEFVGKGMILLDDRFELGEIEEQPVRGQRHRHRWWKPFAAAAGDRSRPALGPGDCAA
jgi:hypothetical protein